VLSFRVRVEMLRNAFDACDSLVDNTRQLWKKSMKNVMAWLRPEIMTSEARYGSKWIDSEMEDASNSIKSGRFDVAGFYEAIKPSK